MGPDSSRAILVPAKLSTVMLSFAAALVLDFLPWPDLRLVPEFAALVLTFWCVRQPRLVGIGAVLGQHALAYSVLAFLALWLSRRILWFGTGLQAVHVAIMLLITEGVTVVVRLVAGDQLPGWPVIVGPLVAAVLWPTVSWVLLLPQRRLQREQTI
jgi:rod shape-determining protein MreD